MHQDKKSHLRQTGRNPAWFLVLLPVVGLGLVLSGFAGAPSEKPPGQSPGTLPPLKVDQKTAPRLEELPTELPSGPKTVKKRADNSPCYVCHGNYDGEELVQIHAEGNVGCMDCHGPSLGHRNDEDHLTPPDKMYPADRIDGACQACHDTHDVPAKKVLARWRQKCPAKTDPEQLTCTDCHGDHRLPRREIVWDKRTGKVLPAKPAPDAQPKQ
jgi:hypothetical protein